MKRALWMLALTVFLVGCSGIDENQGGADTVGGVTTGHGAGGPPTGRRELGQGHGTTSSVTGPFGSGNTDENGAASTIFSGDPL